MRKSFEQFLSVFSRREKQKHETKNNATKIRKQKSRAQREKNAQPTKKVTKNVTFARKMKNVVEKNIAKKKQQINIRSTKTHNTYLNMW